MRAILRQLEPSRPAVPGTRQSTAEKGSLESQRRTAGMALDLLDSAERAETTWVNPLEWSDDHGWKDDYSNPDKLTAEEIAARRNAFDAVKTEAKAAKSGAGGA